MYRFQSDELVIRISDGAAIPRTDESADYRDCLAWLAQGNELLPPAPLPEPTPIEKIRAIEAPNDDNRKKITRQFMLAFMFKEAKDLAKENPATASWTDEQVQAYLMAQGKGYAKLYLEEVAIIPLRELI